MSEQIDRQMALAEIDDTIAGSLQRPEDVYIDKGLMMARKIVEKLPAIKPERMCGKWVPIEYDSYADGYPVYDKWECSNCGHEHNGEEDTLTAFCPDCGFDMMGENNYDFNKT